MTTIPGTAQAWLTNFMNGVGQLAFRSYERLPTSSLKEHIALWLISAPAPLTYTVSAEDPITARRAAYNPYTFTDDNRVFFTGLPYWVTGVMRSSSLNYNIFLGLLISRRQLRFNTMRDLNNFLHHVECRGGGNMLRRIRRIVLRECRGQYALEALRRLEKCTLLDELELHFCIGCYEVRLGPGRTNSPSVTRKWRNLHFRATAQFFGHPPRRVVPKPGSRRRLCAMCKEKRAQAGPSVPVPKTPQAQAYQGVQITHPQLLNMMRSINRNPGALDVQHMIGE